MTCRELYLSRLWPEMAADILCRRVCDEYRYESAMNLPESEPDLVKLLDSNIPDDSELELNSGTAL